MFRFLYLISNSFGEPWTVISPNGVQHEYPHEIDSQKWLVENKSFFSTPLKTDLSRFVEQCIQTRDFLSHTPDAPLGILSQWGYTKKQRVNALTKVIETAKERPSDLQNPVWWHENFRHFVLHNHNQESDPTSIRLTKYVVYQVRGSSYKTSTYDQALWAVRKRTPDQTIHGLSRLEILEGTLEKQDFAYPLVWLTKQDALEAQMQGTIEVEFPNGKRKLFNVHRHNNMPYQKGVPPEEQLRYWYFREVHSVYGWGKKEKVAITKDVSFAGDVENLGFGSLIWITKEDYSNIGLVVDTGGAFAPNLGQLDWFIGSVQDKEDFYQKAKAYPVRAQVEFLIPRIP